LALLTLLAPISAVATTPPTPFYAAIEESPGHVRICAFDFGTIVCPDQGLLRQDADAAGDIVKITTCDLEHCFLDDCVQHGSYRYGLAVPFECGAPYYEEITVQGAAPSCVPSVASPVPAAEVPWTNASNVTCSPATGGGNTGGGGCGAGPTSSGGAATMLLLLAVVFWARRYPRRVKLTSR
jgi:hypothetical protein